MRRWRGLEPFQKSGAAMNDVVALLQRKIERLRDKRGEPESAFVQRGDRSKDR